MVKYLLICAICAFTLPACEQQKQASADVGAIPKTILDKATNDIKAVETLAAEKMQAIESSDVPAEDSK